MKKSFIFLMLFFCYSNETTAQSEASKFFNIFSSEKVTFPVYGAVFQMNNSGNHNLKFVGQSFVSTGSLAYTLWKKNGNGDNDWVVVSGHNNINIPAANFVPVSGETGRLFHYTIGDLDRGWYKLKVHKYLKLSIFSTIFRNLTKHEVQFGVGDVYYVAGQSNASGWPWSASWDNAISTTGEIGKSSPMVKTLSFKEDKRLDPIFDAIIPISKGIPYKGGEHEFIPIVNKEIPGDLNQIDNQRINIYPNGYNSWAYGPLGYKIATKNESDHKFSGTPTLWFNCATGGTSVNQAMGYPSWMDNPYSSNSLIGKLNYTLLNFAGPFGAKAILWHQGEYDNLGYLNNPASHANFHNEYKNKLSQIIDWTRQAIDNSGSQSANLNWFISEVSFTPFNNIPPPSSLVSSSTLTGSASGYLGNPSDLSWVSSGLKGIGQSTSLFKPGTTTYHPNIFQGPATDNLTGYITGSTSLLYRASRYLIHFSGKDGLNALADSWYSKLYNSSYNSVSGTSVAAAEVISLQTVSNSGGTYTLTAPAFSGAKYFWVKNNEIPVTNISGGSSSNVGYFNSGSYAPGDYLVGYVLKNGRLHPIQPYLVPGGDETTKKIRIQNPNLNIPGSGGGANTAVVGVMCDWEIISSPTYFTIDYNEGSGELVFSAPVNTTSYIKSENITLREVGGSYTETINISQPPNTSTPSTSLTTLTPTNNSSEWSGHTAARFDSKSIDGNTMQVSGVQYYQGIGTHANSRMVYNLSGGGYTTFYGKVGRDDEADNGSDLGKVKFSIKTDGSTVWASGIHGNTTGAENFSISVSGKSTLELVVDQHSDNTYYDHANWMDVFLSGGGSPCSNSAPTGVSASPSSHGSGGGNTTLTATCSSGTSVQWSTGHTGSPVTVFTGSATTYTAKCVSGPCTESSPVGVTVAVGTTGCGALTNDLVMGHWTVTGHPLVAKYFHGSWWLVQRIGSSPEQFLVRGSEMLTRGDVTLTNSSYSGLVSCFAYTYSNYGGLQPPSSVTFPTPSGYSIGYEPDGTPYYTASGAPPSGCTDAYLTNSWTYASAGYNPPPKIGQSVDGNNMTMGGVNYSSSYPGTGIGTHATSEIIYDLGASHGYTHFKATVGKDNETMCNADRLVFKVYNNATSVLLDQSPTVGNPAYGLSQTHDMSVGITGVRYLKLVVEDGGDGVGCDHANWARARLACSASGRVAATDTSFFTVYPNVSRGDFTVSVELATDLEVVISLISSSGAVYKQESYKGTKGKNALKFNAGSVMSGLYHVRVSTKDRLEARTVVIER